ncbi:MAG: hypothetical protein ACI9F9_000555 [Candidatus Paceibacteria bacterium]|jgi:uncharacterized protein (DUF58 family)
MEGFLDDPKVLDARQFRILVRRLADSWSYGTDQSPFLGAGVEYAQSRPYAPGDPVRSIDWRVTARTGEFFVKEFESPKRMPVHILIDTSASMTVSSVKRSKYETAMFVAGGVALACLDRVSPVGVIGVGDRSLRIQPSLSSTQVLEWLLRLRSFRYDEETHLSDRIAELTPRLSSRALIIVLSDLHDVRALRSLKRMAQRHDCAVLQFQDPAETGISGAGFLRAQEAETGAGFATHGRQQHLEQAHVQSSLKRGGIDHLLIRTDQDYVANVRQFFESRGLLGKMAR